VAAVGCNNYGKSILKNFIKSSGSSDCQYIAWLKPIFIIFPAKAPIERIAIIEIVFFMIS